MVSLQRGDDRKLSANACAAVSQAKGTRWPKTSEMHRSKLGLSSDEMPWTDRPNMKLRGLSAQQDRKNFLHELVNLRWCALCRLHGQSFDSTNVPINAWVDVRQEFKHQLKQGGVCLLSGSLPYWFFADRVAVPLELLMHQGWNTDGLDVSKLALPVPGMEGTPRIGEGQHPEPGNRRRRIPRSIPCPQAKTTDIAGNMMCVPDLLSIWHSANLSVNNGKFEFHAPSLAKLIEVLNSSKHASSGTAAANFLVIDHTLPADQLVGRYNIEEPEATEEHCVDTGADEDETV